MDGNPFLKIQRLGRALMLPIAVLPVAGLLLRLGQPDVFNIKMIADAGGAIFDNLPLLFAIGVAVGFAKDNNGVAGLAGAIGYLVEVAVMKDINDKLNMGVLSGVVAGIVAGMLYNRFKDIRLPEFLAFFGGKRFVPIVTGLVPGTVSSTSAPAARSRPTRYRLASASPRPCRAAAMARCACHSKGPAKVRSGATPL